MEPNAWYFFADYRKATSLRRNACPGPDPGNVTSKLILGRNPNRPYSSFRHVLSRNPNRLGSSFRHVLSRNLTFLQSTLDVIEHDHES